MLEQAIRRQAEFIYYLHYEDLPPAVLQQAKRIVLDSIGCIAAGTREYSLQELTPGRFTVVGSGRKAEKSAAVFLNAAAMVKNELDEGNQFAFGHPACHILPALLAECEEQSVPPRLFLAALVAAYETACRWGGAVALHPDVHIHGTMTTMASAAVVSKLKNDSPEEIFDAIVLANTLPQSSAWTSAFNGDQVRNAYVGMSNVVGSSAPLMTRWGIAGSVAVLETVWTKILGSGLQASQLTAGLGDNWLIGKNYFKMHTACRYIHAVADMGISFMSEGLKAENIRKITIKAYKGAAALSGQHAPNAFGIKFSIPVSAAILFLHGELTPQTVTDEAARNQRVRELAQRIFVEEDPAYTALLPEVRTIKMIIETADGAVREKETRGAKGDYFMPFSETELKDKFKSLTARVWDNKSQQSIIEAVDHLEEAQNMNILMGLL